MLQPLPRPHWVSIPDSRPRPQKLLSKSRSGSSIPGSFLEAGSGCSGVVGEPKLSVDQHGDAGEPFTDIIFTPEIEVDLVEVHSPMGFCSLERLTADYNVPVSLAAPGCVWEGLRCSWRSSYFILVCMGVKMEPCRSRDPIHREACYSQGQRGT